MFCNKCGNQVPDSNAFCGVCGAPVSQAEPQKVEAQVVYEPVKEEKKGFFKAPGKGSKGFAAIATALMVFPASLSIVIDLLFHRNDGWCLYIVGALLCAWMVIVYPALNITPAPVTALISFFSVIAYILFVIGRVAFLESLYKVALPLVVLLAVFIAVDSALAGAGKLKGIHAVSLLSIESVVYLIAVEATFDNLIKGEVNLRWSLIVACFFVSAIAVIEAINYVARINKK